MYFIAVFLFVSIIYTIMVILDNKRKQRKHPTTSNRCEEVDSLEVSKEDYYKVLNFMLLYGVITFEEYTQLERKSLAYIR